jgi:CRISPR-associated protein Cas1
MANAYVREQGAVVRKRDERLVVTKRQDTIATIQLHDLDQLVIVGNVQLTTQAVALLLQRNIDVVFMSIFGRIRGHLVGDTSKYAELRVRQLQVMSDEALSLPLARQMVMGKLTHQRALLERAGGNRMVRMDSAGRVSGIGSKLAQAARGIGEMAARAYSAENAESLLGYEGKAGAYYWEGFRELLQQDMGFHVRAYRPPTDPVNALLSFGYALLQKDVSAAVGLVGMDAYLGFFHVIHYGRPSLVLDLMEEFRPMVVDAVVLSLVNTGKIGLRDFRSGTANEGADEPELPALGGDTGRGDTGRGDTAREVAVKEAAPKRAVFLNSDALRRVIEAYEQRATSLVRYPLTGEQTSWRRCMELQARQLARVLKGESGNERGEFVPMMLTPEMVTV